MDYHDIDGNPVSLDTLCRQEPEWAASRIRVAEHDMADLARLRVERDEARVQLDTLRDRVADETSIINDAIQAQIAQRHTAERERDEARAQVANLRRHAKSVRDMLADWRNLARAMEHCAAEGTTWPDWMRTEYDRLVLAGPLPEPDAP